MSTWRIITVAEEQSAYKITAVAYNSSKYDYVERDVPLGTRDVSDLNEPPTAPTNLAINEVLYESNGQVLSKLIVTWRAAERALTYEVRYRYNNGNWVPRTVRSIDIEIQNSDVGTYEIEVIAIGALNSVVTFKEFSSDPNKLQLIESRQFQALELSRATGIPAYLLGIGVQGYTYQNAQSARQDLYLFGAKQYLDCIEQTLSMNNILPRGRYVEFDIEDYLAENDLASVAYEPSAEERRSEEMA
jgi:hypothetical protein